MAEVLGQHSKFSIFLGIALSSIMAVAMLVSPFFAAFIFLRTAQSLAYIIYKQKQTLTKINTQKEQIDCKTPNHLTMLTTSTATSTEQAEESLPATFKFGKLFSKFYSAKRGAEKSAPPEANFTHSTNKTFPAGIKKERTPSSGPDGLFDYEGIKDTNTTKSYSPIQP